MAALTPGLPPHRVHRVFRSLAAVMLVVTAGGLLSACGSGSSKGKGTSQGTRSATPSAPSAGAHPRLTKQQARAFADAVNLTAADTPGFTVAPDEHEHETAADKRLEREAVHCAGGLSSSRKLIEVSSKSFKRGQGIPALSVSSEVSVARTAQVAARELAAIRSGRIRRCFSHYLGQLLRGKELHGASIGPVSIAAGTPPATGATGSFGWRVTVTITAQGIRIPFSLDILGFVYGPAQVSLFSSGVPVPFPAGIEQRLYSLLLERAKVHGAALSVAHE